MAKKKRNRGEDVDYIVEDNIYKGFELIYDTSLSLFFSASPISYRYSSSHDNFDKIGKNDWAYVRNDGRIVINSEMEANPKEWEYIIAHCLLHLGFNHIKENSDYLWNIACDWVVDKFLKDTHIGVPPKGFDKGYPIIVKNEEQVYQYLKDNPKIIKEYNYSTTLDRPDMVWVENKLKFDYEKCLAESIQAKIIYNMKKVKNPDLIEPAFRERTELYEEAREWFISSYPLLGAVAASFKIIDNRDLVYRYEISIAAVDPVLKEIYINNMVKLSLDEWKFVLAHEFLHAALRHDQRCEDRNPTLWNIACDYVINNWLVDMHVGSIPENVLYDASFKNISAESLYDILYENIRQHINAAKGKSNDIIYRDGEDDSHWSSEELDDFYHRSIQQGLEYSQSTGRGHLPADLVEEIYSLSRPPIHWDVELAKWFDENFTPIEKYRTYSRMSRRQSSTPDIPRPAWRMEEEQISHNIFAVLLDTSGSMDRHILAAALGTIASYSESRDIHHIRLVFCDAKAYDKGIISPDDLAEAVEIRGRGGTVLQPGIDLLDNDPKFPKDAPLLIITDGACDRLNLRGRNHAYLITYGNRLPFTPKGPVFKLK